VTCLNKKHHLKLASFRNIPYLSTLVFPVYCNRKEQWWKYAALSNIRRSILSTPVCPLLLADFIPHRIHLADVLHYCVFPCNPRSSSFPCSVCLTRLAFYIYCTWPNRLSLLFWSVHSSNHSLTWHTRSVLFSTICSVFFWDSYHGNLQDTFHLLLWLAVFWYSSAI